MKDLQKHKQHEFKNEFNTKGQKYIKKIICTTTGHQMDNYYARRQSVHFEKFLVLNITY